MLLKVSDRYYKLTHKRNLYNIMPIENIKSVIQNGILCFDKAAMLAEHASIVMKDVQQIRAETEIPNDLPLHRYANLYFAYNNPMLYKRRNEAEKFCILVLSHEVLDIEGCVLSDQNAATSLARFFAPSEGIQEIDFAKVFAKNWNHEDYYEYHRHKAIKCAEVLVPECIPYSYVIGAYVLNEESERQLKDYGFDKPIRTSASVFYR